MNIKKIIISGAAILAAWIGLASTTYVNDKTQQSIVFSFNNPVLVNINPLYDTQREEVKQEIISYCNNQSSPLPIPKMKYGSGLRFKLPWENVVKYDNRLIEWDGDPGQIVTLDKRFIFADVAGWWYVKNPFIYYQSCKTEEGGHAKLDDVADANVRDIIASRNLIEAVRTTNTDLLITEPELAQMQRDSVYEGRDSLTKIITTITEQAFKINQYGIGFFDIQLPSVMYNDDNKLNIEKRMKSERERVSAQKISEGEGEYAKIMGEKERAADSIYSTAYREAQATRGGGTGISTKIYGEALSKDLGFYNLKRSCDMMSDKDVIGGETEIIVDPNDPVVREVINGR